MECLGRNDVRRDHCLSILHISLHFSQKVFQNKEKKDPPPHYEERSGPPTQTRGDQQLQGHHARTSIDPG